MTDRLAAELERIDDEGAADLADTRFARYMAWIDGAPIAAAMASFTDVGVLFHSGSTLPAARGRGAYRALVAARWDDAVQRGTPLAVTRAGPMSRPILARVGFMELAEITFLVDRFAGWVRIRSQQPHPCGRQIICWPRCPRSSGCALWGIMRCYGAARTDQPIPNA